MTEESSAEVMPIKRLRVRLNSRISILAEPLQEGAELERGQYIERFDGRPYVISDRSFQMINCELKDKVLTTMKAIVRASRLDFGEYAPKGFGLIACFETYGYDDGSETKNISFETYQPEDRKQKT